MHYNTYKWDTTFLIYFIVEYVIFTSTFPIFTTTFISIAELCTIFRIFPICCSFTCVPKSFTHFFRYGGIFSSAIATSI